MPCGAKSPQRGPGWTSECSPLYDGAGNNGRRQRRRRATRRKRPMSDEALILADDPAPHVRRLTLNRPAKRNALSNALRGEMFAALEAADRDPEVRVILIRGAGTCFSSGYDLAGLGRLPFHTAGNQGQWARHVVEGC